MGEFLKGYKDLESFLKKGAPTPRVAHKVLSGICQAVAAMHTQKRRRKPKYPHGDFHYGNIMINNRLQVKIIDPKSKKGRNYFSEILYIARHASYLAYGKSDDDVTVGQMLKEHQGMNKFLVTCYGNGKEKTLHKFRDIGITEQTAFGVMSWEIKLRKKAMKKIFSAQKLSEYVLKHEDMFEN